tara:strand:+ start:11698 stop:11958 length:261 start_codon:yes stop_codon:yes gene_type:complete
MAVKWEYIKKRRNWNVKMVLESLDEKSWENLCLFLSVRGIEFPPKSEYDLAIKELTPVPVKVEASQKKKRVPRKSAKSKKAGSNNG